MAEQHAHDMHECDEHEHHDHASHDMHECDEHEHHADEHEAAHAH